MCGILAIINKKRAVNTQHLEQACSSIRHRGPDDEGFLTWQPGAPPAVFAGADTAESTKNYWRYDRLPGNSSFKVGLGHRRLSILDLSPNGHQPMRYAEAGLSIVFNGEIYNYLEIKKELEELGHQFHTTCDTEVILHAWNEWGHDCVHDFNGMFAFVILDERENELYAVRDRFGVKPLFYYNGPNAIYIASEIKQIRTSPDYTFQLNELVARQYLTDGTTEYSTQSFDKQIHHLAGGHYLEIDLSLEQPIPQIAKWYTLAPKKWHGTFDEAVEQFKSILTDSVKLRLRSDVKVGSCLSGGLDSSSIVCIAAQLLKAQKDFAGQETVTACFQDQKYSEWSYAEEVIRKANAHSHRVFPDYAQLREEVDKLFWHQDEPFANTSIFTGWMVFKKTHEAGLKVMIDGQGADEHLAGYGGYDLSFYSGLLRQLNFLSLFQEVKSYKKNTGNWPYGFLLGALKFALNAHSYKVRNLVNNDWLHNPGPSVTWLKPPADLRHNLMKQLYEAPLPSLLRFEDRNSMAWSVESRTPFMDYRLVEFDLGLPERFIYNSGVKKYIMRKAMHGIIPASVEQRTDKMGYVTPEETWLREGSEWLIDGIGKACKQFDGYLLNADKVNIYVSEMMASRRPFDSMPWRIFCFHKWFNGIAG